MNRFFLFLLCILILPISIACGSKSATTAAASVTATPTPTPKPASLVPKIPLLSDPVVSSDFVQKRSPHPREITTGPFLIYTSDSTLESDIVNYLTNFDDGHIDYYSFYFHVAEMFKNTVEFDKYSCLFNALKDNDIIPTLFDGNDHYIKDSTVPHPYRTAINITSPDGSSINSWNMKICLYNSGTDEYEQNFYAAGNYIDSPQYNEIKFNLSGESNYVMRATGTINAQGEWTQKTLTKYKTQNMGYKQYNVVNQYPDMLEAKLQIIMVSTNPYDNKLGRWDLTGNSLGGSTPYRMGAGSGMASDSENYPTYVYEYHWDENANTDTTSDHATWVAEEAPDFLPLASITPIGVTTGVPTGAQVWDCSTTGKTVTDIHLEASQHSDFQTALTNCGL